LTAIEVFRNFCLDCHDTDGRGELSREDHPAIPDFTDPKWHSSRTDAELKQSILEGKGKGMPRMKKKLGTLDVMQMVSFVRAFQDGNQIVEELPAPAQASIGSRSTPSQGPPAAPVDPAIRTGSALFQRLCAKCHGSDGSGTEMRESEPTIPDFTKSAWHETRTDAQLHASIRGGKGGTMPAFRAKLNRADVFAVVSYLRSCAGTPSRPAAAPDDFELQFKKLVDQLEEQRRQFRAIAPPPARP
jgi:mono/diheme cytochrome c family protein